MDTVSLISASPGAVKKLTDDATRDPEIRSAPAAGIDGKSSTDQRLKSNAPDQKDPARQSAATPPLRSDDSRYTRFVEAVQGLRLDSDTATELTPERVRELRVAAIEVFALAAEIPRDLLPSEAARATTVEADETAAAEARAETEAASPEATETDTPDAAETVTTEPVVAEPTPTTPDMPATEASPTLETT